MLIHTPPQWFQSTLGANLLSLTGSRSWTGLARLVPGLPHVVGAAAHLLGHVERQLVFTRVVEVAVAHALPHVCIKKEEYNRLNTDAESWHSDFLERCKESKYILTKS